MNYNPFDVEPTVRIFDENGHELCITHKMWTKGEVFRVVVDLREFKHNAQLAGRREYQKEQDELVERYTKEYRERMERTVKLDFPEQMKVPDLPLPPAALTERKPDGTE